MLDRLDRSDVRLIVSGHLHQHRDRSFGNQRHLWVPAVAFSAPQDCGGDGRCGLTVLDFSSDGVEVTIEYPRGLVSHDLAAIKEHGRKRAESLVAASELDSNPVVPAVRFQLTARDFGLVFAPSFLRPACTIRRSAITKFVPKVWIWIPTKIPTKRMAAADFCVHFQCAKKNFPEKKESNQSFK